MLAHNHPDYLNRIVFAFSFVKDYSHLIFLIPSKHVSNGNEIALLKKSDYCSLLRNEEREFPISVNLDVAFKLRCQMP